VVEPAIEAAGDSGMDVSGGFATEEIALEEDVVVGADGPGAAVGVLVWG